MMLSNFIRRNGKRKGKKANESQTHSHQQPPSASSPAASPPVFDIHEDFSISSTTQSNHSLMVELDFSDSYEEWFPRELLQSRGSSPRTSVNRTRSVTLAQNHSVHGTHADLPSRRQEGRISPGVVFRKKSIPAPIVIPDIIPNIEIGRSDKSAEHHLQVSRRNTKDASKNPPSPSASEDLSAISGTTLARLIASSFVLSSSERRGSRHRSVVGQDSATLPRGEPASQSGSGRSSPGPPAPPVLVSASSNPNHPVTTKSGASTQPDSYITSPETMIGSVVPRRMSRIQEVPSPTISVSARASPFPVPDTMPQRKVGSVSPYARAFKNGVFDVPITAIEAPLTSDSQEPTRRSSQAFLSHDDHSLDEFDFVAPEHPVAIGFSGLDSSASSIALQLSETNRGQRKLAVGGANSRVARKHSKKNSPANLALVRQPGNKRLSVAMSEHDYGELLNYDLTLSCGSASPSHSSHTPSSGSAGYQTFPETPMVFSPLWSPPSALLPRPECQLMCRHSPSSKPAGLRSAKLHSSTRTARRQLDNKNRATVLRRSRSSHLPTQKLPSPKQAELVLLPSAETKEGEIRDESNPSFTTNGPELVHAAELQSGGVRSHPLARISTSSSCLLEEEALRALAGDSPSSISVLSLILDASIHSPTSVPLPDSPGLTETMTTGLSSASPPQLSPTTIVISQPHSSKSPLSCPHSWGSSFLPSPSPSGSLDELPSEPHSPIPVSASSRASNVSMSPSFLPPPPYHTVVSERTPHYPDTTSSLPLSHLTPAEPALQRNRQASNVSSQSCPNMRTRVGRRPPPPMGPRKPSRPGSVFGSIARSSRNGSVSSVDSSDRPGKLWRKLQSVISEPPPKFHSPPPKWRGLTLEAAQWTFTSEQLQKVVSQAIQQSSEGSSLRLLRLEVLDGEIADEVHRLELQHTDVKAQYKALVRKRWALMGTLASHIEGEPNDGTTTSCIMQELADVLLALDQLADKMHDIVLQLSQLKSLRDVHNASALALAVRKINGVFVRQMAEKERLQEQVDTLQTERDEAWQHAEDIAQDYDTLSEHVSDTVWVTAADIIDKANDASDAQSFKSGRRSTRISAVRKSSIYQSQAGLRSSTSKRRSVRSSMSTTRPASPTVDIPPVPPLPVKTSINSETAPVSTGVSRSSYSTNSGISDALALAQAQREVYEMLGLSLPPSQASSRRRTISWGFDFPEPPPFRSRPMSESLETRTHRVREHSARRKAIKSAILDDRPPVGLNPLTFLL